MVGLISASLCGAALFLGGSLLAFFPKPIAGGLLLYLGLSFLVEWLYDGWFKLPKTDYFLVCLILFIVGVFGFMEGVGVGVLVAIVLSVVNYSRINVVKHTLSGTHCQSNVDRTLSHKKLLDVKGEQIYVLKLQGYIFFGTANNLLDQIRRRTDEEHLAALDDILLSRFSFAKSFVCYHRKILLFLLMIKILIQRRLFGSSFAGYNFFGCHTMHARAESFAKLRDTTVFTRLSVA